MSTVVGEAHLASLPQPFARLHELAFNLWWTWQPEAVDLFSAIDPDRWQHSSHNAVTVLQNVEPERLAALAADQHYVGRYNRVIEAFDRYMRPATTWFSSTFQGDKRLIAYFCAEYGLHESLPIYSGGLGVLAGDHCKTASDLGLPFLAVGLWYTGGYLQQHLDAAGQQGAEPESISQSSMPLQFAGQDGSDLRITVPLPGRSLQARVWRLQVGRVPIYLLDPDVAENSEQDRAICSRLYGGDRETRIQQEVLLGIGGVHAIRALGLAPTRWHMNEGHAGFMGLERIRELVQSGVDFTQAWPAEAESTVFTTHTPVPAGNEVFRQELVRAYLADMPAGIGLDEQGFMALAREEGAPEGTFAMTPLALRLSHRANGVSKLHGAVARGMWMKQFPGLSQDQVPITSITNGVHTGTWIAPALRALFDRYLGADWLTHVDDPAIWEQLDRIPDTEIWQVHRELKARLLAEAATRAASAATQLEPLGNPDALTIGFARRFATYKRATLFFRDEARALRILSDTGRPVQIVFSGKAHPADGGGQAFIKSIVSQAREADFRGKVLFLEGYDIGLARTLVQGVDLWLNNPERPQEASGTSGQKAALNGIPNCSIRDGWWDEGFDGHNGWAFGGEIGDDEMDSKQLYDVLEQQVIPTYFDRDETGIPVRWVAIMKNSIRTLAPAFSSQRMVKDYMEQLYS